MFYKVKDVIRKIPRDFHSFGYEDEHSFSKALHALHSKWAGLLGECINERNGFLCLRFRNIYRKYEDAWIPAFMLDRKPNPSGEIQDRERKALEEVLNSAFGFD